MYPESSRYRTVYSASVKPEWVKIDQVYPYFIYTLNLSIRMTATNDMTLAGGLD